jgi:hypothetical protein
VRLDAPHGTHVEVLAEGRRIASFETEDAEDWEERSFDVPPEMAGERTPLEVRFSVPVTTFHYWFVTPG